RDDVPKRAPFIVGIGGLVKACNGLIVRFELGRLSALIEGNVGPQPVGLQKYGRIVAIALVLGFLVGLTLPALVVGHDAPNVTRGYRAGLSTIQHRLHVWGNSVHYAVDIVPIPAPQLSAERYALPFLVNPLEVDGDTSTIAAASEDCGPRVVAPNPV